MNLIADAKPVIGLPLIEYSKRLDALIQKTNWIRCYCKFGCGKELICNRLGYASSYILHLKFLGW